jgi:hypothetical protein
MKRSSSMKSLLACGGAFAVVLGQVSAVTVVNGDFETDANLFTVWPGYTGSGNPEAITGWTHTGGVGINPGGIPDAGSPFDDPNTTNATNFAFIQGTASLSQDVSGFSVGTEYLLGLDFNARGCCGEPPEMPVAEVSLNGTLIASSVDLFGGVGGIPPTAADAAWYHADVPFTATAETLTLTISTFPAAGGDSTLVIDNVSIIPEPSSALLSLVGLTLLGLRRRRPR